MIIRCLYDKLLPIEELKKKFHPKNRNQHPPEQITRLAKILKYQGARSPAKISNQSDLITTGHGRILAAEEAGWEAYPVNFQDYDNEDQEYADLQADNSVAAWAELDLAGINADLGDLGPDFDIDLLGIKDFVLEPAEKLDPGCDEDEVPEHVEPKTCLGDIYSLGNHRLMCGDSTSIDAVEKLMNGEKAELCFTSPPYGDQREYNDKSLNLDIEHISGFIIVSNHIVNYYAIVLGLMRKDGAVFPYWDTFIKTANNCDLKLLSWNIWNKMNDVLMFSFNLMFAVNHEWIFVFGKESKKLIPTVPNKHGGEYHDHLGVRQKDGTKKKMGAVTIREFSQLRTIIDVTPQKARNNDFDHPAMFSVELPERYIEAIVEMDGIVYEPFGGSGTTLIACEKTNRRCFMMELDPHYCDIIVARGEKYTDKKAELLKPDEANVG